MCYQLPKLPPQFRSSVVYLGAFARRYYLRLALLAITCFGLAFYLWLAELDEVIEERMVSLEWPQPARIYARALELYPSLTIKSNELVSELRLLGYQESSEKKPGNFRHEKNQLIIHTRGFEFSDGVQPPEVVTLTFEGDSVSELSLASGKDDFLRLEPLEIASLHAGIHEDRVLLSFDDLPPKFVDSLIAVEDKQFRKHHGISIRGMFRAALINMRKGSKAQGGSTITQQLVKGLFLTRDKTWSRKLREIFMALVLDWRYSKEEIIAAFVNEVFLAQDGNRAIHGFGLASLHFFDRPIGELRLGEYALLVGMLKAPSRYHPIREPERAQARRDTVLSVMHAANLLTDEELQQESNSSLLAEIVKQYGGNAAYIDTVKQELIKQYDSADLQTGGQRVFTYYNPVIQAQVHSSTEKSFKQLSTRFGQTNTDPTKLELALVLAEPNTGSVVAMMGGRTARYAGFNRVLDAKRHVGSLLKPALFLTAWQQPELYSLASIVADEQITMPMQDGSIWQPKNFNGETDGDVIALEALSRSLNLAAIDLGMKVGIDKVVNTLEKLGFGSNIPHNPSLLLGAHEFSVFEMTQMYQTIAADGFHAPLRTIREVVDSDGNILSEYPIDVKQQFDLNSIYLLKYALATSMFSGTGQSANAVLPEGFQVAGKTGTSNEQRDSWFAGFSGDYVGVVWLGADDNQKTPVTGSSGALSVWTNLFSSVSKRSLSLLPPADIEFSSIDPVSGYAVNKECDAAISLPFVTGHTPKTTIPCPTTSNIVNWFRSLLD